MKYSELINQPLFEMAMSRQAAMTLIINLESQINIHLIKLLVVDDSGLNNHHWRAELRSWCRRIARIEMKTPSKKAKPAFYFDLLYTGWYGHDGDYLPTQIEELSHNYKLKNNIDATATLGSLREFHARFADLCSNPNTSRDDVDTLIALFSQ